MNIANWFSFASTQISGSAYLPDIFPMSIAQTEFVQTDVENIFAKILTDVVERTQGIPEDVLPLLWDNCLQSEASFGLITLISKAMTNKEELFLVYREGILRRATHEEMLQIKSDYEKKAQSSVGIYISFRNYLRADMIRFYSALEYCAVASLNKQMNLSKAVQYKYNKLRETVSLIDKKDVFDQAVNIANNLAAGKDIMLDAGDKIETAVPNLEATKESILFLDSKRCFYLGMPMSYVSGELNGGLGDSGQADARAVERGLKNYYFSVIKPVVEAIFKIKLTFKSENFQQVATALEALKTFDLISDSYLSAENKTLLIDKLLDLNDTVRSEQIA